MKYLDEYRDADVAAAAMRGALAALVTRPWALMEVCGGQTHTIVNYGIDQLLPPEIELVHGPGCPVCVTPLEMIDRALAIAARPDVIFCSFGDMLRVPGSRRRSARGARPRAATCASSTRRSTRSSSARAAPGPRGRLLRHRLRDHRAANAMAVWQAQAARADELLAAGLARAGAAGDGGHPAGAGNRVQGFLGRATSAPSWAIGEYEPLAARYRVPIVVTGFEPLDLLAGHLHVRARSSRRAAPRSRTSTPAPSRREGNAAARRLMLREVFEVCDRKWRGVGAIPTSGLRLRDEYRALRRRAHVRRRRDRRAEESAPVHQRPGAAGAEEAARLPGVRQALHARDAARRDDGLVRRRLRRLLPLPPPRLPGSHVHRASS